jgi:hypothetical protein
MFSGPRVDPGTLSGQSQPFTESDVEYNASLGEIINIFS